MCISYFWTTKRWWNSVKVSISIPLTSVNDLYINESLRQDYVE